MKRILPLLALFVFLLTSCSYEPGVSEAFNKYRFKDGVVTISVPGWLVHLAANMGELEESEREILESIDKVKVIAVEDDHLNQKINLHEEFYSRISQNEDFEELMVVREEDQNVTIFGKMDDDVIKELLILVGGEDNALIYVKGEIRPELLNDKVDLTDPNRFLSFKH
ncbi:DUF4252 domain-containing protein [Maribellus sp. CM-23]|uniref:DUF4252 domain-containing protein n=1 Tax=Maribellus sp. CM-23 TaxID=2781026 RepID=UPI001F40689F|nr:DUF4252 domain-containing protein [Maribellus sp. CM-23]MCE4566934.1 DUF4252 domain-containing protein [Maribellus sp. CM-23]